MLDSLTDEKYLPFLIWCVVPLAVMYFLIALIRPVRLVMFWFFFIMYLAVCALLCFCDWFQHSMSDPYSAPSPLAAWPAIFFLGASALVGGFFLARSLRPERTERDECK